MIIEKLVYKGDGNNSINLYCMLGRDNKLYLLKYHSIIEGSEYIKSGNPPYMRIAIIFILIIAAIITPILVLKYKK
jgi:hypothetical protein